MTNPHFDTLAVRAGRPEERPCPSTNPIALATSYIYDTMEELDAAFEGAGPFYRRDGNPSTDAFARACAALDGAGGAVAFASGMAALHGAVMATGVRSGDTVLCGRDLYSVTARMLTTVFSACGVRTRFTDLVDPAAAAHAIAEHKPRVVVCESLSNPTVRVADVSALARAAREAGAALLVDNSFASPWLYRPLADGADMVIHSATKYLGGHGDAMGGVVTASDDWLDGLRATCVLAGAALAPFDATLLLRGIRTLPLRMERHSENALRVARWLEGRPEVSLVNYPGLPSHPQHALADRLFSGRGFGGMLSFEIRNGGRDNVARFMDALTLALPGPTLGDAATLAMYPAMASHRSFSPVERARLGVSDGLVRLSVGLEHADDIIADLDGALNAAARAPEGAPM